MDAKLLEKIEELTLYSIEQNKQIKQLQEENKILKSQSEDIKELKKTSTGNAFHKKIMMKTKLLSLFSLLIGFWGFRKPKSISNMTKPETNAIEEQSVGKKIRPLYQKNWKNKSKKQ
jgi:hypothetical protein